MVRIVNSHRLHPYSPFMMYLAYTKKKKMWQYALLLSSLSTTICSAYSCSTPVNPIDCFWPPKVYSSICLLHMSFIADICYLILSTYLSKITVYHKGYHLLFMNWMHAMSRKTWFILKFMKNFRVVHLVTVMIWIFFEYY